MLFEEKVYTNKQAFLKGVQAIADKYRFPADWLMLTMYFESGLNPAAVNPKTKATGLIQFMPSTAKWLGTTVEAIKRKSNVEQLKLVDLYLKKNVFSRVVTINHPVDLYLGIFFPASIDDGLEYVYPRSVWEANKLFDLNKDGRLTKAEIQEKILSKAPASYQLTLKKKTA